jgi:ParB family chromosome partitioning protein
LPEEIRNYILAGDLSEGHARALLALDNIDEMQDTARMAINLGLSVRQLEERVRRQMELAKRVTDQQKESKSGKKEAQQYRLRCAPQVLIYLSGRGKKRSLNIQNIEEETASKILALLEEQGEELFPGK